MRITIERLRRWFLVLAVMLIVGLTGTFFYARYRVRRVVRDLPAKLGVDIQQSAKEFTFSKSEHGRTLFTLRASKALQYKEGGRVLLHDFAILLYGKDGRADRISGSEFEFDPSLRLATANGEVHLDLHAPQPPAHPAKNPNERMDEFREDAGTVHVLMHGLVFDQTSGDASTQGEIEFRFPQASGRAHGANFDSAGGLLELQSDVDVTSASGGRDFRIRAAHASFQRDSRQMDLTAPRFDNEAETASAAHAVAQLGTDGRPQNIRAGGGVTVDSASHVRFTAPSADGDFDSEGKLRQIRLSGGVHSTEQERGSSAAADAQTSILTFARDGTLQHVALAGAVAILDAEGQTRRDLKAEHVDASFVPAPHRRSEAKTLTATGAAVAHIVQSGKDKYTEESTLSADTLTAELAGGKHISHLEGHGHAQLARTISGGATQTASSDELAVNFAQPSGPRANASISSAVQRGNVVITQAGVAGKAGTPPATSTTHAQLAEYRAATETVTLTGDSATPPRLTDGALDLSAQRIELARVSGDAVATGSLKATYIAGPKEPPLHVIADRGELYRAQQRAVFAGHARLWQQGSSIEAPVLEMTRASGRLVAHGDPASTEDAVHGVFVSNSGSRPGSPVRISSQRLTYSDADHLADFEGGTLVESADAQIRADRALVTLREHTAATAKIAPAKPRADAAGSLFPGMSGAVERIVSTGHIVLEQPGRKGSGAKLVYTASDGRFVLTGTPTLPPQLTDAVRGTITGNSLIFLSREDSVQVGDDASGTTITRTRVQDKLPR